MKRSQTYTLSALVVILLASPSCETMNKPFNGGYNPLDAPAGASAGQRDPYDTGFAPGSFLQTISPSTAFFARFPGIDDQPSKILSDYMDVKVISTRGTYVKVEVVNTGEVGYVPSVMLGEKRSPSEVLVTPGVGGVPSTPGVAPEPELPIVPIVPEVPGVAPEPEVPGIEPPEIVDPSKPAE